MTAGQNCGAAGIVALALDFPRAPTRHADLLRFVQNLITFTQTCAVFREERFWYLPRPDGSARLTWHGVHLHAPDWGYDSHALAFELRAPDYAEHLYIILNTYWEPLSFELPPAAAWQRILDTALPSPADITLSATAPLVTETHYRATPRSIVVLLSA